MGALVDDGVINLPQSTAGDGGLGARVELALGGWSLEGGLIGARGATGGSESALPPALAAGATGDSDSGGDARDPRACPGYGGRSSAGGGDAAGLFRLMRTPSP